jgi:hypothetical protein
MNENILIERQTSFDRFVMNQKSFNQTAFDEIYIR